MKKTLLVLLLVVGVSALTVTPGYTWRHWRGGVFVGVGPYWGPYPYYYYPPPPVLLFAAHGGDRAAAGLRRAARAASGAAGAHRVLVLLLEREGLLPDGAELPGGWVKVPERPR